MIHIFEWNKFAKEKKFVIRVDKFLINCARGVDSFGSPNGFSTEQKVAVSTSFPDDSNAPHSK